MAAPYRLPRNDPPRWIYGDYDPKTSMFTPEDGSEPFQTFRTGLSRFTGRTDSNGVPIYNGDFVHYEKDGETIWCIVWVRENDEVVLERTERYPLTDDIIPTVYGDYYFTVE